MTSSVPLFAGLNGWVKVILLGVALVASFVWLQADVRGLRRDVDTKASQEAVSRDSALIQQLDREKADLALVVQQHEEIMRMLSEIKLDLRGRRAR